MTATEHPRQSLPDTLAGGGFSEEFTEHLGALAIHHRKHGEHILGLGITCPCLPTIALSAVPHLETAPLPDTSDVRSVSPARDAVTLDYDEASRVPALLADKAALMGDVDRLTAERDRARGTAATLEAENARLTEALYLTRITLEATFRVLQEASGLPDDIDDPDCRDEMVLALRPRAEKAEAEVARLREGIEALSDEMQSDTCPACHAFYADEGSTTWGCDHTEGMQHAGDMLRALLAEGGE